MAESNHLEQEPFVSIIIPALNEGGTIAEMHRRITAHMKTLGRPYEIIFIDDGSRDDTHAILEKICGDDSRTGYVRHFRSHGKSLALMQGFEIARGAVAVTLDGDLQDEPENIGLLLAEMERGGYDLVNGFRANRQDKLSKKVVSKIFNSLVHFVFKPGVRDVNSGLKAYSKALYKRLELRGDLHRLTPVIAANDGYKVSEIKVTSSPRTAGKSKYRLLRYRGLLDIISLKAADSTQLRPFHVFGGLGILSVIAGFVALLAFYDDIKPNLAAGNILLLALLVQTLFLGGIFLFLAGMLAEILLSAVHGTEWRNKWIKEVRAPGSNDTKQKY